MCFWMALLAAYRVVAVEWHLNCPTFAAQRSAITRWCRHTGRHTAATSRPLNMTVTTQPPADRWTWQSHCSHQPTVERDSHTAATSRPLNVTVTLQPPADRCWTWHSHLWERCVIVNVQSHFNVCHMTLQFWNRHNKFCFKASHIKIYCRILVPVLVLKQAVKVL